MATLGKLIPTFLAALIGGLSVLAGTSVLLKITAPNYQVLEWLVVYNVVLGVVSLFVAYKIWITNDIKSPVVVLGIHILILAILLTVFADVVAIDSLRAMSFRIVIWGVIISINYFNKQK